MIANSSTSTAVVTTTSPMRKPTGITNQSSTMTNNSINKTSQQQVRVYKKAILETNERISNTISFISLLFFSSSIFQLSSLTLPSGKKQQLVNGTEMTESQNPTGIFN
jgi:hypothetical protein